MSRIKINNIVSKSLLVPPFSLASLLAEFPLFSSESTFAHIFFPFLHTNFSIFPSGSIISRASISLAELEASFNWLRSFLSSFELELSEHYEVLNIVAFADITPSLNLFELASYLPNCSYDPSPMLFATGQEHLVNVVVFYFSSDRKEKPRRTALIFPTGNVTLTGFNSFSDLENHAVQLSSLLQQISEKHPEVLR